MTPAHLSLDHILRPAQPLSEKAPVIIMLHGYGSDEHDLFSFTSAIDPKYLIVSAKAPVAMQPYGNAWYAISYTPDDDKFINDDQAVQSRDLISQFIDEVASAYHADAKQVTLMGFSQGAVLSYAVALSYPEKVNRVVAMSGYIHEDLLKKDWKQQEFAHLSFYCSHGNMDTVVPVEWDRKTKPFLDRLGIENTYAEFPAGHGVNPENFKEIINFLNNG